MRLKQDRVCWLRAVTPDEETIAVISDDFWDDAWSEYIFQDDFSKAAVSEKKWAFLQGKWTVKGSALKQDRQKVQREKWSSHFLADQ